MPWKMLLDWSHEMTEILSLKSLIEKSVKIVGFTGAGVSTDSGISDYRSQGGLWEKFTPVYIEEFIGSKEKRQLYWERKKATWESIRNAKPGRAHLFFKELHGKKKLLGLITQNIDGLHEKSGLPAERIVNLHGNTLEIVCLQCGVVIDAEPLMDYLDPREPPACRVCQGLLKPNTISFGQQLVAEDLDKAERLARDCDLMIAFGSTLKVQPAASFPLLARESGAKLVIVTKSDTPLDTYADFVFHQNIDGFLEQIGS